MTFPTRIFRAPVGVIALLVCALPLLSGCEEGSLNAPNIQQSNQTEGLFDSYVSIGNSITAGFQSAGINSNTQAESYAALLADSSMGTPFGIPKLATPGCPPPLEAFPPPPPSPSEPDCALRSPTGSDINNVAVPGAALSDVLSNVDPNEENLPPGPNELTQFILGGRTQIEAALDANPTFATVWIGNNDVLGAANLGNPALATSASQFESNYRTLTDKLKNEAPLEGAVLIGVADVSALPGIFKGQFYPSLASSLDNQLPDGLPNSFNVDSSCNPGNKGGTNEVSFLFFLRQLSGAFENPDLPSGTYEVSCGDTDPGSLTPGELSTLSSRASDYNSRIQSIANGNEKFVFFNPNNAFSTLVAAGEIPSSPDFTSQKPFGDFFSLDGIHPSSSTHRLVTNELAKLINQEFDANLPLLKNAPELP
jgi:lysophospholipase L1-like esterase